MPTRAPDYDEIIRVVQLYVDGHGSRDIETFKEAFHEDARIFYTDPEGTLHQNPIKDSFDWWANSMARSKGRIISVTQAGDVAGVVLGIGDPADESNQWVDFHSLIRVKGTWKITNKTATHASRAGGV